MSITPIHSNPTPYKPVAVAPAQTKPTTSVTPKVSSSATGNDPDHDGDTDGPGLDVNG